MQTPNNADDPMFQLKKSFIEKNDLVVWRFHDHWHAQKPDGIISGMAIALGWQKYQVPENVRLYTLPKVRLATLAKEIRQRLKVRAIRVIGDPDTMVSNAAFNPGSTNLGQIQRYFSGNRISTYSCAANRASGMRTNTFGMRSLRARRRE